MAGERQIKNYNQLGTTGLRYNGGYVYEEFLPQLRWPRAGDIYKEMADNDPVVGAILYLAEMFIRKVDWNVREASTKQQDIDAAIFLKQCMNDMDTSWADFICEVLSMLTYGFSFHEVVYKLRKGPEYTNQKYNSKHTDGRIGWRRMPIRSQASLLEWTFDDDGDVNGFVQLAYPDYQRVEIPLERGLLFRTRVSRNNPEGKSLLRNAYRPWYFKKRIEEIEGIGIERDLAGLPVLTAPEGLDLWNDKDEQMVALKANAEALVQSIRRDAEEGILLPNGWDLKLLATGSSRQFDTNAIINRYDNRIAITMLSDLILIGGDKTGSFAMAETKQSLLSTALEAQLASIAEVLNKHAVPKLMQLNNFEGLTEYPQIVPGEVETPSIKELSLLLRAMGLNIAEDKDLQNHLRKIASIPQVDDETFERIYVKQGILEQKAGPLRDDEKVNNEDDVVVRNDTADRDFEQNDMAYTGQEE